MQQPLYPEVFIALPRDIEKEEGGKGRGNEKERVGGGHAGGASAAYTHCSAYLAVKGRRGRDAEHGAAYFMPDTSKHHILRSKTVIKVYI